jgi:hypothetical protein
MCDNRLSLLLLLPVVVVMLLLLELLLFAYVGPLQRLH